MVDLFQEVDEGLRTDEAADLVRRAAPFITGVLGIILAGYLGYWAFTSWQAGNEAKASLAYQQGVDALSQGDERGALGHFADAEKDGAPGYKMLALLQEGDIALGEGKADDASKKYDSAAAAAPNPVFGDLAKLKAADAIIDTASLPQMRTRLTPLADPKRPYAAYAKEALAMAELMAGKTADAKKDCDSLQLNIAATDDMRQRCQIISALIDRGEAQIAITAAKVATIAPTATPSLAPPLPGPVAPSQTPPSAGAAK